MSAQQVLYGGSLQSSAQPWLEELGKSDKDRLLALIELAVTEKTRLSDCLDKLFPGVETKRALADFTRLRSRLNDAADGDSHAKPDLGLRLHVDTRKQNPPNERLVWFTGPPPSLDGPTKLGVARLPASPVEPIYAPAEIKVFVSFATNDKTEIDELVKLLHNTWGPQRSHQVKFWRFHNLDEGGILVGEDNEERIREEIAECPFGLLLLSPDYTSSSFIKRVELPAYFPAPAGKHPILVNLRNSPRSAKHLPKGMDRQYIFSLNGKSYSEMTSRDDKERFAMALNDHIEKLCTKLFSAAAPALEPVAPAPRGSRQPAELPTFNEQRDEPDCTRVDPSFDLRGSFDGKSSPAVAADTDEPSSVAADAGVNAINDLIAWAQSSTRSCYFALLGEVGAGKTTAALMFAQRLNALAGPERAYYFDMRYVNQDGLLERTHKAPKLEEILAAIISRQSQDAAPVSVADYLQAVRAQRAILIFDGLDEVLVGLDTTQQDAFMQQLMMSLPPAATDHLKAGKLLLACRTHFFRSSITERGAFTIQGREGIQESDSAGRRTKGTANRACFEIARLLPFTEAQIRSYFEANLPSVPFDRLWDMLARIHNLQELATRPYLLNLIRQQLPRLNAALEQGQSVSAIDLYAGFLEDWGQVRNREQNLMRHEDKLQLMAELAAWMWRNNTKAVPASELENWLLRTVAADTVLRLQYGDHLKPRQVEAILADLRTATFIARWQGDAFRFAHTSLQEYFLASYMVRSLREGNDAALDLPETSLETLDFLGEMIAREKSPACLRSLERVMGGTCLRAACLAFQYWLQAIRHGMPEPAPALVNLEGATFDDREIKGHSAERPLNLRGANLRGIQLNRSRVQFVDAADADLTGMAARQALFIGVSAPRARVVEADLAGLQWRQGSLLGADVHGTDLPQAELIHVGMAGLETSPPNPHRRKAGGFTGHSGPVMACAWSPDGRSLLSASDDKTLKVWDAQSGQPRLSLTGHSGQVWACAWSPDGRSLLSASADHTLKVWDAQSGLPRLSLAGHSSSVLACAWSPDGRSLLSASADKTLKVWDAQSGQPRLTLAGHSNWVRACAWSPDGRSLLSASDDHTLKVWDAQSGQLRLSLTGHSDWVLACAWSPDGRSLLSASDDKTLKVWDAQSGQLRLSLTGHSGQVRACAWSPDGRSLLSASADHTLKVWDAQSGQLRLSLTGHSDWVLACAWSPDGRSLLSASYDHTLKVWDAQSGQPRLSLTGHSGQVRACAWSPDGRSLLSASEDHTLKVWDAQSGLPRLSLTGHSGQVRACAWSPDGRSLLSASDDKTLKVWDAQSGQLRLSLAGHSGSVLACAWSPDGRSLLSASADKTLKVWDAQSGQPRLTLAGHSNWVRACAWSPDGRSLLSASDDHTLKVWDAQSGQPRLSLTGHSGQVRACAWSPDGRSLLSASADKTLKVWDAQSGQLRLSLTGHSGAVWACAWSPDGRSLLSASDDHTLKVWDAQSGQLRLSLTGHSGQVRACAWSPDGRSLLSASADHTLKVWDAATGECLWTGHHLPEGQAASLSGDQQRVLGATHEAWRWLGWQTFDAGGRFLRRLPIEAFGPIPMAEAPLSG